MRVLVSATIVYWGGLNLLPFLQQLTIVFGFFPFLSFPFFLVLPAQAHEILK